MISVVIPTYQNPIYLELCLRSAIAHQVERNQIIVVLDGPCDASSAVLARYAADIDVVEFPENRGQQIAHNTGVTLAESDRILIVNDDNVFPEQWDIRLNQFFCTGYLFAPNQIEPTPSMFPGFEHADFGTHPDAFDMSAFVKRTTQRFTDGEQKIQQVTPDGQTWPVFMEKRWYMILNGIDTQFPSPAVADWDFFLRAELAGLRCVRIPHLCFYHFAGAATKRTPEAAAAHALKEQESFVYFEWKWGYLPVRSPHTNSAFPHKPLVKGVYFT